MNKPINRQFNLYFFYILSISLISLLLISYSHARPFGGMTASHINNAIKKQIRAAIVPILKSKKNKIQYPKKMYVSKSNRYLLLSMQGGYISL